MSKKFIVLLILTIPFTYNIVAQSISESLGGVHTNFQIFSDSVDLNVSDQIIILRAEKGTYSGPNAGFGYGYRSYHLEFITYKPLFSNYSKYNDSRILKLIFYDEKNRELATRIRPIADLMQVYNEAYNPALMDFPIFYSIDLISIPIVLLDKTRKINITTCFG